MFQVLSRPITCRRGFLHAFWRLRENTLLEFAVPCFLQFFFQVVVPKTLICRCIHDQLWRQKEIFLLRMGELCGGHACEEEVDECRFSSKAMTQARKKWATRRVFGNVHRGWLSCSLVFSRADCCSWEERLKVKKLAFLFYIFVGGVRKKPEHAWRNLLLWLWDCIWKRKETWIPWLGWWRRLKKQCLGTCKKPLAWSEAGEIQVKSACLVPWRPKVLHSGLGDPPN